MKTLNRPMFRYGGPIKEGVMHGIREPKRNGGSMGAALVGIQFILKQMVENIMLLFLVQYFQQ